MVICVTSVNNRCPFPDSHGGWTTSISLDGTQAGDSLFQICHRHYSERSAPVLTQECDDSHLSTATKQAILKRAYKGHGGGGTGYNAQPFLPTPRL